MGLKEKNDLGVGNVSMPATGEILLTFVGCSLVETCK